MSDFLEKMLGKPIGPVFSGGKVPKDGDGDGMYTGPSGEDNIPAPLAIDMLVEIARKSPKALLPNADRGNASRLLANARDGGFTKNRDTLDDIKNGIAVARDGFGLPPMPVEEVYFPDGTPRPEAVALVLAWLDYHGRPVFDNPSEGAREVALGGWIEDGKFYMDVTDVYESTPDNLARATQLGKAQDQKSVAILEKVWIAKASEKDEDWAAAFLDSGGSGGKTIDPTILKDLRAAYMQMWKRQQENDQKKSLVSGLASSKSFRIMVVD